MAASRTLPQQNVSRKSPISKTGVLTLSGFGIKVRMQRGHLEIEDGVGLQRRKMRLARVGHGLKRLVIIGSDGFVSLGALEWLEAQNAAFVLLERNGKVLSVTGPVRSSDAKLRRAQALALGNISGLEICRTLIDAKLEAQERVSRDNLECPATADTSVGEAIFHGPGNRVWSDAAGTMNALTGAYAVGFAAAGAAVAAPVVGGAIVDNLAFGASAGRVFYSGHGAAVAALSAAGAYGGRTINTTPIGRLLEFGEDTLVSIGGDPNIMRPLWNLVSGPFAAGATGPVLSFQSWGLGLNSIWGNIEYPILTGKGLPIIWMQAGW